MATIKENETNQDSKYALGGELTDALFQAAAEAMRKTTEQDLEKLIAMRDTRLIDEQISRFMSVRLITDLEGTIAAFLEQQDSQRENKDSKNGNRKSFLEWVKAVSGDESDNCFEFNMIRALKNRTVKHGINLSRLVLDFMFPILDDDRFVGKVIVFTTLLKWVLKRGEKSIVICRIVELIDAADTEIKKMKISCNGPIKGKGKAEIERFEEQVIDEYINELVNEMLRLDWLWTNQGLPDSKILLKDSFPFIIAEIRCLEKVLESIKSDLKEWMDLSELEFGEGEIVMKETDAYKAMVLKIDELWSRIEEHKDQKKD